MDPRKLGAAALAAGTKCSGVERTHGPHPPPGVRGVGERAVALTDACEMILRRLIASLHSIPFELRWVCKCLVRLARCRFNEITQSEERLLVGSFMFLRFYGACGCV